MIRFVWPRTNNPPATSNRGRFGISKTLMSQRSGASPEFFSHTAGPPAPNEKLKNRPRPNCGSTSKNTSCTPPPCKASDPKNSNQQALIRPATSAWRGSSTPQIRRGTARRLSDSGKTQKSAPWPANKLQHPRGPPTRPPRLVLNTACLTRSGVGETFPNLSAPSKIRRAALPPVFDIWNLELLRLDQW